MNAPKYDTRIRRKGGYCWASECDAETLSFWARVNRESAAAASREGKYVKRDERTARALEYFAEWRRDNPGAIWEGIRGDGQLRAAIPHSRPVVHPWEEKGTAVYQPPPPPAEGDDDFGF